MENKNNKSAGVWVKASKRLPDSYKGLIARFIETKIRIKGSEISKGNADAIEWLDESIKPDESQSAPVLSANKGIELEEKVFSILKTTKHWVEQTEKIVALFQEYAAQLQSQQQPKGLQDLIDKRNTPMRYNRAESRYNYSEQDIKDIVEELQSQQQEDITLSYKHYTAQGKTLNEAVQLLGEIIEYGAQNKPVEEDEVTRHENLISDYIKEQSKDRTKITLVAKIKEAEKDKISDEEISKQFNKVWQDVLKNADHSTSKQELYAFFKAGFKAKNILQKGSEDKIEKAIDFVDGKINKLQEEINQGWRGQDLDLLNVQKLALEEMKTFLQSPTNETAFCIH